MAVTLNPRADRLLARLPRVSIYSAGELLLLLLIAVQCARLFWATLVPLGPVGEWKALDFIRPAAPAAQALGSYDPFFRGLQPGAEAPAQVTTLEIRLYGVMGNQATGGGTAIIGLANGGQQRSYAIGDEIMPGVTLAAIGFDNITVTRNGAPEQLYMDQTPAAGVGVPGGYASPPSPSAPAYIPPPQPVPVPTVTAPPPPPPAMAPSPRR